MDKGEPGSSVSGMDRAGMHQRAVYAPAAAPWYDCGSPESGDVSCEPVTACSSRRLLPVPDEHAFRLAVECPVNVLL